MRKPRKPPNLAAKAVRSALCRPRIVRSKKLYSRKRLEGAGVGSPSGPENRGVVLSHRSSILPPIAIFFGEYGQ